MSAPGTIPPLWGAPHGDPDPETGLPTVEVTPRIAEALAAAGWHRDPANIEGEYVEGDWVLDNVGAVPRAYSIEPSGHHRSVIVHRGPVCDSPVFAINQQGTTPVSPAVVLAAVNALIADDTPGLEPVGDEWGLVIDQVVGLSAVYDIDVHPRTAREVHDAWHKLIPIIAERAETLRTAGHDLMKTTAGMLRSISRNMTSQPFDGSVEIDRLANELDPPDADGRVELMAPPVQGWPAWAAEHLSDTGLYDDQIQPASPEPEE